ncbi:LysR substrate-binding domain-containing protein, partial [Achromobacter sp.]|uniref:LysR substrate-binding domain-containing protein n=1 Tax=Achromobacter sp. TaxID=134375 RepID=UPI0028B06EB6
RVQDEGELLWEEDLVWAWGADKPWKPGRQVPLAVFPEPCVYREAAIAALGLTRQGWAPVFESGSMAGCLAAALAGFAVAPVARSQLREGLRALSADDGMPDLPMTRFYAYLRSAEPAVQALVAAVRQTGQRRRFGR